MRVGFCCNSAFGGSSGGGDECCSLADTLLEGNITGGTDIEVTTGDAIVGQTDLNLIANAGNATVAASADVVLSPVLGSAFVNVLPIITSGVNLGPASDADVFSGTGTPTPNGTPLNFRRLTAGANVTITQNLNDIEIAAAGGAAASWAATLAVGQISGGTDPQISSGDELQGVVELVLRALGASAPLRLFGGNGTVIGVPGGNVEITAGGAVQSDGGQFLGIAGQGDTSGSGGRWWDRGGQGGPVAGQGGVRRASGGDGGPGADGGLLLAEGGTAGGGGSQGGAARFIGGLSDGVVGETQVQGRTPTVNGPGGPVVITTGNAATTGPAQVGGDFVINLGAGAGGGAIGNARIGTETILTTCASVGGGASVVQTKGAQTVNGVTQSFRSITAVDGGITVVQGASTIDLESFSDGTEIQLFVSGGTGLVGFTLRRTTVRGRQSMQTQMVLNIAAGTLDVELRWRSVTNLTTSTARARHMWGRSNLGNTSSANATGTVTTTSSTFALMTSMTMNLNAGEWVITASVEIEPPNV